MIELFWVLGLTAVRKKGNPEDGIGAEV